ncbi:hypothetical protein M4578_13160 [Salipiger sp. P9]|uniref:hypothetical protein n=1 Tax=Salipiger pentaromativorans TaxID=2943193 RepID=UPI002157EA32|nr:hypothetical protein [Salipiger pentaromativorans]MCR8548780.1 hypothetical protein [Salipiger pentaromativorans]
MTRRGAGLAALLALVAVSVAPPASALSCMAADVTQDFANAAASPDNWVVVEGALDFDPALAPPPAADGQGRPASFEARFSGMALAGAGFIQPFDRPVTVRLTCSAHWCGSVTPGRYLAFLKQEAHGYALIVGPCPTFLHRDPTEAQKATVASCFAKGGCD